MRDVLSLNERLEQLLSEAPAAVTERRQNYLEEHIGSLNNPFVLFGAGRLGRETLNILRQRGFSPLAFIDNSPQLQGCSVEGVPVFSPWQFAQQCRDPLPPVIVTIWCGEAVDHMADRVRPLHALGFNKIAMFGHLAWRFPDDFLPHYCLDLPENVIHDAGRIRQVFNLLSDDDSRRLFVNHVAWRLHLDYDLLPLASPLPIYFSDCFLNQRTDEVLYDIGAFDGDSIQDYLDSGHPYQAIHAFEPNPNNFVRLNARIADLSQRYSGMHAHQMAVGDVAGTIAVEADNGPSSRVGCGQQQVQITTLDLLCKQLAPPTFIKMDIEGFEPQCLSGGRYLIQEQQPALAVCVYHAQDHLWNIPLQLNTYRDDYRFHLCQHVNDGWDLVLYAIPPNRSSSTLSNC